MLRKTVVVHIPNERLNNTATFFIKKANEFTSHITVSRESDSVNAKSLLGLLSMRLEYGMPIDIAAEGVDAAEALTALEQILDPAEQN
nr:HPr family phosphocarrier protein [uncultured Oscillibacter sp.]